MVFSSVRSSGCGPRYIVSDCIVEVKRISGGKHDGRLMVRYETPCPHWAPPRWLKRSGIVDEIIVCCGFNYTLPEIFDRITVNPATDDKGKYCLLTPGWESTTVSDLYFIGASMRVNDPDASSGFVHGFRCNIQSLAQIIAEKHHGMALEPVFECKIPLNTPAHALSELSSFLVEFVSNNMPLFELFSHFGSALTFDEVDDEERTVHTRVWPAFPRAYNRERWGTRPGVEIVFEYGFSMYGPGDLRTHYFTLPADHFDTSTSAYIHPVFHDFREGVEVGSFHMQESLIGRWDLDDYVDAGTNVDQYANVAFNACACALGMEERRSMKPVLDEYVDQCYPLMTEEEVAEALRIQPILPLLRKASDA